MQKPKQQKKNLNFKYWLNPNVIKKKKKKIHKFFSQINY
jgi:hypothetical protein